MRSWMSVGLGLLALVPELRAQGEVAFDRDVRPILSEYCFACHGPDERGRKAKLRLDTRDGLFGARKGGVAVVPGKPDASLILQRITAAHPKDRMPPRSTKRALRPAEVEVVRRWIEQGAPWQGHWAFTAPVRPELPKVNDADWARGAIDRFVLARLEAEGLRPARPAVKRRWLRRVTLDLTGLPPTPEELRAFVADASPRARMKVIDRLLASPRYGERMAWDWLDAARYADTNGYQGDGTRTMWPYRDWVIGALQDNLPYDSFLVWQLAGDLLPGATYEQKLATGFCRNHMINGEGGRIAEENRVEYIFDQVETLGATFLGLTLTCARCHDHKYDPIRHRDYFALFDYFNQTPVTGAGGNPQTPPNLVYRTAGQRAELRQIERQIAAHEMVLAREASKVSGRQMGAHENSVARGTAWRVLKPTRVRSRAGQTMRVQPSHSVLVQGRNPNNDDYTVELELPPGRYTGLRLEALRHPSMTAGGLARSNSGNFVLTRLTGSLGKRSLRFTRAVATYEQGDYRVRGVLDRNPKTGWAVYRGRPVRAEHRAVFTLAQPLEVRKSRTLVVVLRHESRHARHNLGHFRLSVTASPTPSLRPSEADDAVRAALRKPLGDRSAAEGLAVIHAALQQDPGYAGALAKGDALREQLERRRKATSKVKVMVMADRTKRRPTYRLHKGLYNQRRETITAAVPGFLPQLPEDAPRNRLSLARWLVDPRQPLTARVIVNRHWQKFFGTGLVATPEDFGAQGEKPSHPKLLDWLATEFVRSGWDVKALHRWIVSSATYAQSARVSAAVRSRDPDNRLLARGPRHRMPSWMIRDHALAVSGLLVEQRGGPPVKPYQPEGVWAAATFGKQRYRRDRGAALYRRSLYTFWRRIIGPTMFFDAAKRQTCTVRPSRTNTPLHALLTLNGTTYVEAARALAQRLLQRAGDERMRLSHGFELATSRLPKAAELQVLESRLARLRQQYAADPQQAKALLAVGDSKRDPKISVVEHAAWTGVCSLLLNLDEALNK